MKAAELQSEDLLVMGMPRMHAACYLPLIMTANQPPCVIAYTMNCGPGAYRHQPEWRVFRASGTATF